MEFNCRGAFAALPAAKVFPPAIINGPSCQEAR